MRSHDFITIRVLVPVIVPVRRVHDPLQVVDVGDEYPDQAERVTCRAISLTGALAFSSRIEEI
jgi:hypothetical protein